MTVFSFEVERSLLARALTAYIRYPGEAILDQPAEALCEVLKGDNGRTHVVLRNGHRTLAVYRVRNTGPLKRLKRWPKSFD